MEISNLEVQIRILPENPGIYKLDMEKVIMIGF